jgi:hypothetical protein
VPACACVARAHARAAPEPATPAGPSSPLAAYYLMAAYLGSGVPVALTGRLLMVLLRLWPGAARGDCGPLASLADRPAQAAEWREPQPPPSRSGPAERPPDRRRGWRRSRQRLPKSRQQQQQRRPHGPPTCIQVAHAAVPAVRAAPAWPAPALGVHRHEAVARLDAGGGPAGGCAAWEVWGVWMDGGCEAQGDGAHVHVCMYTCGRV